MQKKLFEIRTPLREEDILQLNIGDKVLLTGEIYTLRDSTHKRFLKYIKEEGKIPFETKGSVVYYCGPTPAPPGKIIGSCGPTTSERMDIYTIPLLEMGVKGMIGKGRRSEKIISEIKKFKAVYFIAIGGAGAYYSKFVKKRKIILFPELGPESLTQLYVEKFPLFVGIR